MVVFRGTARVEKRPQVFEVRNQCGPNLPQQVRVVQNIFGRWVIKNFANRRLYLSFCGEIRIVGQLLQFSFFSQGQQARVTRQARFSERTYGRFGSYFVATATKEKPVVVSYRIWLQEGQMKPDEVAALDKCFVEPVKVKVK